MHYQNRVKTNTAKSNILQVQAGTGRAKTEKPQARSGSGAASLWRITEQKETV